NLDSNEFKLTTPEDSVEARDGDDVTLPCHLSPETSAVDMTIRWFKGTACIYLFKNGQVTERSGYEGRVSLITQELERGNVIHGEQKEEAAVGLRVRGDKCSRTPVMFINT
uniref:Immunoglobulin V-set domain-containing protein n=1 Tax=Oncorhynchus tshawytscha TaxID=74940 RepID=A0A8C8I518_ONCTS